MQKRFRIWQNFRCTRLYTNTRSSTTWRFAHQTRTFFCVFLQAWGSGHLGAGQKGARHPPHVRSHSIPATPFENEMKSVSRSSLHPSTEAVNFECTCCWIRPRQLKKPVIGAAESCASWSTLVRWPNAGDDLAFKANRNWNFMSSFSFECKMDFRKHFVGSPGNEDSVTKTAKVPQAVQAVFFYFFFYFYHFRYFFFAKKLTHKQVRPRNVVVLIHMYPRRSFAQ